MDVDGNKRVFHPLGLSNDNKQQKVCFHWRAGKCSRYPCPYLQRELPPPQISNGTAGAMSSKRPNNFNNKWGRVRGPGVVKKTEKICNFWVQGNCSYGNKCRFLHSWCTGDCFSLLTQLEGHQQVVTGIALPSGSDKLYSASKDATVRVWDCQSGQCAGVVNLGGEVGCRLSEGPWMFVGLPNVVKAWNVQTNADLSLSGPVGQVYDLVVGMIYFWRAHRFGALRHCSVYKHWQSILRLLCLFFAGINSSKQSRYGLLLRVDTWN